MMNKQELIKWLKEHKSNKFFAPVRISRDLYNIVDNQDRIFSKKESEQICEGLNNLLVEYLESITEQPEDIIIGTCDGCYHIVTCKSAVLNMICINYIDNTQE